MIFSPQEKLVFKKGYRLIAGIDESGLGSWAGPVAAAAVAISTRLFHRPPKFQRNFSGVLAMIKGKDSKLLSEKQREEIFEIVKNEPGIEWRVSFVWPKLIDRLNIWQATLLAWQRSLKKLNPQPDFLFLDGRLGLPRLKIKQQSIIKGDQKIFLLSLASIIAKVSRDGLMRRLEGRYPGYGFSQHKGYGTKLHLERLKKIGPCQIHRKSFRPIFKSLPFEKKVYYLVSQIPLGQIMTYQEVAQKIGQPLSYRAVGNALHKNLDPKIPCHRVIRSNGQLGGYRYGSQIKKELLKKEGFFKD